MSDLEGIFSISTSEESSACEDGAFQKHVLDTVVGFLVATSKREGGEKYVKKGGWSFCTRSGRQPY